MTISKDQFSEISQACFSAANMTSHANSIMAGAEHPVSLVLITLTNDFVPNESGEAPLGFTYNYNVKTLDLVKVMLQSAFEQIELHIAERDGGHAEMQQPAANEKPC